MENFEIAQLLALIGGILSIIVGVGLLIWGSIVLFGYGYATGAGVGGILGVIFGFLTLFVARPRLGLGGEDLKTGGIMCIIFGVFSGGTVAGILTIVAGIIGLIAWNEGKTPRTAPPPPPPPTSPPPPPPTPTEAVAFCANCGSSLSPDADYCPSCGARVEK